MNYSANRFNICVARFNHEIPLFADFIVLHHGSITVVSLCLRARWQLSSETALRDVTCDWCTPLKHHQITVHTQARSGSASFALDIYWDRNGCNLAQQRWMMRILHSWTLNQAEEKTFCDSDKLETGVSNIWNPFMHRKHGMHCLSVWIQCWSDRGQR